MDEYTFLLSGFNYDGNGADTFFWAGASNRPGPQGFIVPDEYGKYVFEGDYSLNSAKNIKKNQKNLFFPFRTNILDRYFNKDFTLKLPDNKKITEIKWLAIYDLSTQNDFGDVYIPESFEPPQSQRITSLSKRSHGVNSSVIEILDSKTFRIPELYYDGTGAKTYFLVGVGAQPSAKGTKIPDELG